MFPKCRHLALFSVLLLSYANPTFSFSPTPIVACSSPIEVHRAISFYIKPNDCVLELGAQLSDTSSHLCRTVGSGGDVILVDIKRNERTSGRSSNRDVSRFVARDILLQPTAASGESFLDRVQYKELEQFDQWRAVAQEKTYHAMILDVGTMIGNDLYLTALSLANEFIANQAIPPRVIIIKSKTLSTLARRIVHSQRLLAGSTTVSNDLERTHEPTIVPCVGVNEYRRTIPYLVRPGDDVIEVGCHFGQTTTLLYDTVRMTKEGGIITRDGFCVGVDIGPKIIANAKRQHPQIPFEVVDAWKTLDLLKIKVNHDRTDTLGYDVVYADIGGLSGAHGLLESLALLDAIAKALEPRCIVIKSLCVNRLASQLLSFSNVWIKLNAKRL